MTTETSPAIDLATIGAMLQAAVTAAQPVVPQLMTASEVAALLGICRKTLRAEVNARRIKFVLIGKRKKFTADDIRAWIETLRTAPPTTNHTTAKPRAGTTAGKVLDIQQIRRDRQRKTTKGKRP